MKQKEDSPKLKVKIWMLRSNTSMIKIAEAYGCGRAFLTRFIQGARTSKGLAKFIMDMGCPEECFKNGRVGD